MTPVLRRVLSRLRTTPRISPRLFVAIESPKKFRKGGRVMQGAVGNATQQLRAAVRARLAHVAFEVGEETYEISARGREALAERLISKPNEQVRAFAAGLISGRNA